MQKKFILILCMAMAALLVCQPPQDDWETYSPNPYVDLLMGTASHPHVHPGPVRPMGTCVVIPMTSNSMDAEPGVYRATDSLMHGFLHTLGETFEGIRVTSVFGDGEPITLQRASPFSFESMQPGFYRTQLDRFSSFAEITVHRHSSFSQFRYQDGWAHVFIEPALLGKPFAYGKIVIANPFELEGFTALENGQRLYFVARFHRSAMGGGFYRNNALVIENLDELEGENIGVYFSFRTLEASEVLLNIGLSYESTENAREQLQREQAGSFALQRNAAREAWERALSTIQVHGGTEAQKFLFYTALYRSFAHSHMDSTSNPTWEASDILRGLSRHICSPENPMSLAFPESQNPFAWIDQYFRVDPMGIPHVGDITAVSAQLVCAMLGIYPDCTSPGDFTVGVPVFQHIEWRTSADPAEPFVMRTRGQPSAASEIRSTRLNGKPLDALKPQDVTAGGTLNINLK